VIEEGNIDRREEHAARQISRSSGKSRDGGQTGLLLWKCERRHEHGNRLSGLYCSRAYEFSQLAQHAAHPDQLLVGLFGWEAVTPQLRHKGLLLAHASHLFGDVKHGHLQHRFRCRGHGVQIGF
jgi:hypothetical protein